MFTKILVFCLVATFVVCNPIESLDDEEIPVYTEKVSPGKPTKPARIPRFESKKLASSPKKVSGNVHRQQSHLREELPIVEPEDRTPKHVPNTIVDNQYIREGRTLRKEYKAPEHNFAPSPTLGVEYEHEEAPQENQGLINDYTPRKLPYQTAPDYGTAEGNEPKLRYVPAPQRLYAAPATHRNEPDVGSYDSQSYNEHPQPYIFGYELKDENGSTQSRKEQGDGYGNKRGSYGYTDGYGIYREVEYVADEHGFRAVIKTNEPGTENQNPADVQIQSEAQKY